MSTSNVRDNVAAHVAVVDLLNRYTDTINQRDWTELRELFVEDSVWDVAGAAKGSLVMRFEGIEKLIDGIAAAVCSTELCVQTNHAPVIAVNNKRATARSTIQEIVRAKGGGGSMILGVYSDDIVLCADGEWRFKERRFRMTYTDVTPAAGTAVQPSAG